MKTQNRISPLTLEYYHRGLATRKERKEVKKALLTDATVRKRYEVLQELEKESNRLLAEEMRRLNIQETPITTFVPWERKVVVGVILAAAILLCALVPAFFYVRSNSLNKGNAIAEAPTETPTEEIAVEPITREEPKIAENTPVVEKAPTPEQPPAKKKVISNDKPKIAETPRRESKPAAQKEIKPESVDFQSKDLQSGGTEIAAIPEPDTGVRMRGGSQDKDQSAATINIPPGITFIFENMFANKQLSAVVIPARITSIGKNAFAGNPLVSVTIGANVSIEENAIAGNFAAAYNAGGKAAGTYTRPNTNSEEWKKR